MPFLIDVGWVGGSCPRTLHPPASTALHLPAGGGPAWRIQHEARPKWSNPLIGWTSTADPLDNVARQLYFRSKEEAVAYAGGC